MMKMHAGFAISLSSILLLGILHAGCLDQEVHSPSVHLPVPAIGLGLEMPATLPAPGPFAEGPDIASFNEFLLNVGVDVLAECGNTDKARAVLDRYLEIENYHNAIDYTFSGCNTDQGMYARDAMDMGTEEEIYEQLRSEAQSAYDQARQRIDEHPGPGTALEAQYLSYLMVQNIWDYLRIDRAPLFWGPYADGSAADELQLRNAYMQLLQSRLGSENVVKLLDRYPWTGQSCEPPDQEMLLEKIDQDRSRIEELAYAYGHVQNQTRGPYWYYTWMTSWLAPDLEMAGAAGWWPRLLALEVHFESLRAYWESFSADAWPTVLEAEYLLALHRNETRSIWTEQIMEPHLIDLEEMRSMDITEWRRDVDPPQVLRLLVLRWPWAGLQCGADAFPQ